MLYQRQHLSPEQPNIQQASHAFDHVVIETICKTIVKNVNKYPLMSLKDRFVVYSDLNPFR